MRTRLIGLISLLALLTAACEQNVVVAPGPSPTAEEERDVSPEPAEGDVDPEPDECADVATADGAPAPLTMKDRFFEPNCLVVSSTQEVTLTNAGELLHNFSIEGTGVDVDVQGGQEVTTEAIGGIGEVEAGTFDFFCKYHRDEGMVGVITVE